MTSSVQVLKMGECDVAGPEVFWMSHWNEWVTLHFWMIHPSDGGRGLHRR